LQHLSANKKQTMNKAKACEIGKKLECWRQVFGVFGFIAIFFIHLIAAYLFVEA